MMSGAGLLRHICVVPNYWDLSVRCCRDSIIYEREAELRRYTVYIWQHCYDVTASTQHGGRHQHSIHRHHRASGGVHENVL